MNSRACSIAWNAARKRPSVRSGDLELPHELVVRRARLGSEPAKLVDISIESGLIRYIGDEASIGGAEIDAAGALVTPGGVDPHCHMAQISSTGVPTADDIGSGTTSAISGGTTTVGAFAVQHRGSDVRDQVSAMIDRVERGTIADVALHLILTEWSALIEEDLDWVIDRGITSLKLFTTYDRLRLAPEAVVSAVQSAGSRGMDIMIHAERAGVAEALAVGEKSGVPIYLVHVSTEGSLEEIRSARSRGVAVTVETCPHYLFLDQRLLEGPLTTTAAYMSSPPLRGAGDRAALWAGLSSGDIDIVASDHSPYRMDGGKLPNGEATVFTDVANGMPGVEMRLPLMMSAVVTGRLTLDRFLEVCCSRPAESLGISSTKGTMNVGSDADLVIWDLHSEREVRHDDLHDAVDYTPYEGHTVAAWPQKIIYRGQVIEPGLSGGYGRFLKRRIR